MPAVIACIMLSMQPVVLQSGGEIMEVMKDEEIV